jgi:hypothetical protein
VTAQAGAAGLLSLAEHKGQGDTDLSTPGPVEDCPGMYDAPDYGIGLWLPTVPESFPHPPTPPGMCAGCRVRPALGDAALPALTLPHLCEGCSRA